MYRTGDQGVMNYICEKFKPLVLKHAKAFFISGGDIDDLIQEGMIGLFKAIMDYDTDSQVTFFHFANLCIKRQIIKAIESGNRKKHGPLNNYLSIEDSDVEEILFSDDPVTMVIEAEDTTAQIDNLMEQLSPMERRVLDLYLQDYSYTEIADELGKSEKSIDNTLTRIKTKAKKI